MHRYSRSLTLIAIALAALAGFVDAVAFASTGFFASFMSGNTTQLGVALGSHILDNARIAGGIVLASSDPRGVPMTVRLSSRTYRKMTQNLWWAAGYNIVAIPLAAGVLEPFGIVVSPALGAVLMSVSTIVVAINAQLLRRVRLS